MLIGLHSDRSRAGKDSIAAILVRNYGFRQVALANAIRELLLEMDPLIKDDNGGNHSMQGLWHDCYKDWDIVKAVSREATEYMIRLGQGARDIIGEDVWINAAFPTYPYVEENIVISDIRQPNEVDWIIEQYGELWYVERPSIDDSNKRGMDGLLSDVNWDAYISNNGTLADLEENVRLIMEGR